MKTATLAIFQIHKLMFSKSQERMHIVWFHFHSLKTDKLNYMCVCVDTCSCIYSKATKKNKNNGYPKG